MSRIRVAVTRSSLGQAVTSLGLLALVALAAPAHADEDTVTRGRYVFQAAGCLGCHTDEKNGGQPLAGGRALGTDFGIFHTPNITPDAKTGIGNWSLDDFKRALRDGIGKHGEPLYPAFPYTSYTRMTDGDVSDLFAYLKSVPPVESANKEHILAFPYNMRFSLAGWQMLFLSTGTRPDNPGKTAEWNRGRYLMTALGHCGECHTPRGSLGAMEPTRYLAGTPKGPEAAPVPGLTARNPAFAKWSVEDIVTFLDIGMAPDGDFVGGAMAEVVRNSTSKLTPADRHAIAVFLKDLPPHP